MILFKDDWKKYPNAIIHYNTKNESFLRLAEVYYRMGISNNAFHLSLLQPELSDVDPFDESLPLQVKAKIVYECKNNPWYVFREIIRVPLPGSLTPMKFRADRSNIALYWLFFNHITTLVIQLRQTGKTTAIASLVTGLLNFWTTNTFINLLTKAENLKAETLIKVKAFLDELPEYLKFYTKRDIFNTEEIRMKELMNVFKGNLSSSSPKQAEKVGRGFTSPINIIDEAAYIPNIEIAISAMLMSGNAAREFARVSNKPYGTLLLTTAGKIDDRDGSFIFNIMNSSATWDEHFFDCSDLKDLEDTIIKNLSLSTNSIKRPVVTISMSYRQLGYGEEWVQRKLAENISSPENIARDIFNQWLSGSRASPIPKEYIDIMKQNVRTDPRVEFYAPYNYLLRWYISEEELAHRIQSGNNFIIGVDTSDAVGRDDIAFTVRDHTTGEILCAANFNEINLITLADFFVSFLLKYENSVMVIERRSSAPTIIDYMIQKLLLHDINPFTRLYNTIFQEKEKYKKEFEEIVNAKYYNEEVFIKYKKHIGFTTSGTGVTSRSELYSATLINMLKYTAHALYDQKLVNQISSLVIKNNRIDHPEGGNDDLVISALLSYWLLINGKNLTLYGVNTSGILRHNKVYLEEKYANTQEEINQDEIIELENEFNKLIEDYKKEQDYVVSMRLEIKIKKLAHELNLHKHIVSAEELIDNIKREKSIMFRRRY